MSRRPISDGWVRMFEVPSFEKHEQGYTVYKVISRVFPCQSPEACTEVTVWKRFSQFRKLHKELSTLHAALYLKGTFPELPKASFFNRFDAAVVEERRTAVRAILEFVALHPPLFTSAVFVKFFEDGDCRTVNPLDRLPPPPLSPDASLASFSDAPGTSEASTPVHAASGALTSAAGGDQSEAESKDDRLTALWDPLTPERRAEADQAPSNLQLLSEPDLLKDLNVAPSMTSSRTLSISSAHDLGGLPDLPDLPSEEPSLSEAAGVISEHGVSASMKVLSLSEEVGGELSQKVLQTSGGSRIDAGNSAPKISTGENAPRSGNARLMLDGSGDSAATAVGSISLPYPPATGCPAPSSELPYPATSAAISPHSFPELPSGAAVDLSSGEPSGAAANSSAETQLHSGASSEKSKCLPYPVGEETTGEASLQVGEASPMYTRQSSHTSTISGVSSHVSGNIEPTLAATASQKLADLANQNPAPAPATSQKPVSMSTTNQMAADIDENPGQYLISAAAVISQAQQAETQCLWNAAFAHYQCAIGLLINGVQGDPCAERRQAVRRKTAMYIGRAEQLADLCSQTSTPRDTERALSHRCVEGGRRRLAALRVTGLLGPRVLLVTDSQDGSQYALKVVEKCARADPSANAVLPHHVPHMVHLHQMVETEHAYFLILQYISHGLLVDALPKLPPSTVSSPSRSAVASPDQSPDEDGATEPTCHPVELRGSDAPTQRQRILKAEQPERKDTLLSWQRLESWHSSGDDGTESRVYAPGKAESTARREDNQKQLECSRKQVDTKEECDEGVRAEENHHSGTFYRGSESSTRTLQKENERTPASHCDNVDSCDSKGQQPAETSVLQCSSALAERQVSSDSAASSEDLMDGSTTSYLSVCQQFADNQRRCRGSVSLARNLSHDGVVDEEDEYRSNPVFPEQKSIDGIFEGVYQGPDSQVCVPNDYVSEGDVDFALRSAVGVLSRSERVMNEITSAGHSTSDKAPTTTHPTAAAMVRDGSTEVSSPVSRSLKLLQAVDQTLQQSSRLTPASPGAATASGVVYAGRRDRAESVRLGHESGSLRTGHQGGDGRDVEIIEDSAKRRLSSAHNELGHLARLDTVKTLTYSGKGGEGDTRQLGHTHSGMQSEDTSDQTNLLGSKDTRRNSSQLASRSTSTATDCGLDERSTREPWWSRGSVSRGGSVSESTPQPSQGQRRRMALEGTEQWEQRVRMWAAQIVCALDSLHKLGIVSRDLHPANLLLTGTSGVCLSYFAVLPLSDRSRLHSAAVSELYVAPELTGCGAGPAAASPAADWWSLGALLYLFSAGAPLRDAHPAGIWPQTRLVLPDGASDRLKRLLETLLQVRPEQRPHVDAIKRHAFFSGVDWDSVANGR